MTTGNDNGLYRRHLDAINAICDESRVSLVRTYWRVGEYISSLSHGYNGGIGYGNGFLLRLSADLSTRYGRGFSLTNLKAMRRFHRAYPYDRIRDGIDWSGYVRLLTVKDPEARRAIEEKIADRRLTSFQLKNEIARERLALRPEPGRAPAPLPCVRGLLYAYALLDAAAGPFVTVDCGFNIRREIHVPDASHFRGVAAVRSGKTGGSYSLLPAPDLSPGDLYSYAGVVERVIDGDTLVAVVDCGFRTRHRLKLRLRGIDTPELGTPGGAEARAHVEGALAGSPVIGIRTRKADKYERYLADIFHLPGETDPACVLREGRFLNQELLDLGLAIKA